MDFVKLDLKNCYGIKSLTHDFDFGKKSAYAIYAANGVMKSSLAQTLRDAASGAASVDRIFPDRLTVRDIQDETGASIEGVRVFVVENYDEGLGPNERTSTLLVDAALREEYTNLHKEIDEAKSRLLLAVQKQASSKANFETEISSAFTSTKSDLRTALTRIKVELEEQKDTPFSHVKFDVIFDDKVVKALEPIKTEIESYVRRYNELLSASTYFKKGTFDYFNAGQIAKSLSDNGFFGAAHTVNLKSAGKTVEIATQKELEGVISAEKEAILTDAALRKSFDAVAKKLDKNAELREFCRYLQNDEAVLSRMDNPSQFKEDVLKSYLKVHQELYADLMAKYEAAAKRKAEIEKEAREQRTQWEDVIAIFNDRFVVPFKLEARNRTEVILGDAAIIELGFTYVDGEEAVGVERGPLLKALSTGEKKALYVLNVIFEIEARKKAKQETLLVVDDLADSFDYQNKYAIIQYLKDISEDGLFKQLILTHNFDFFRTLAGRFVGYGGCLMASKNAGDITLAKATGIRNVFANDWKKEFFVDPKKKIASICFLRNLIEMTRGEDDPHFEKLTSMLHWKADTASLSVGDLDAIYNFVCGTTGVSPNPQKLIHELISEEGLSCLQASTIPNLENKIVLAMAIRLAAERYMLGHINDQKFADSIKFNQTHALLTKFRATGSANSSNLAVLDKVTLMTPENIHVNSFMYEPILDMSDGHLRRLYDAVLKLN